MRDKVDCSYLTLILASFVAVTVFIATEAAVSNTGAGFHSDRPHENTSIAADLYEKVRVLCMVITSPGDHQEKAIHVKNTWGARCNKLIFMSTKEG